jgi:hypothetical protein
VAEDGHIHTERSGPLHQQRKIALHTVEVTVGHIDALSPYGQHLFGRSFDHVIAIAGYGYGLEPGRGADPLGILIKITGVEEQFNVRHRRQTGFDAPQVSVGIRKDSY